MPRVSAKRKAKSEIGRENIKKRWKKDDVSQHVVAELPASPDPPPPPSSTSFLQPPTQSAATFRHNLIPQQYREVQEKLMVCKMDPHNPEVKKENDIEDEASPSTILPNTSLYLQFGIKEESEGSENNQFMVEVKEESDIKIEEEDLPPQEDSSMFDGQEEPSLGESRSKKRSKLWSMDSSCLEPQHQIPNSKLFAEFFEPDGPTSARCLNCKKPVRHDGRTSNLITHLRGKAHQAAYKRFEAAKKRHEEEKKAASDATGSSQNKVKDPGCYKLESYFSKANDKFPPTHPKQKKMLHHLIGAVAVDGLPMNSVEKVRFRNLLLEAEPRFNIPARKTISNKHLPENTAAIKGKIKHELAEVAQIYATVDVWTDSRMNGYFGFTVHFVDGKFSLKRRVLACRQFNCRHTAENIAAMFDTISVEYGIQNKVTKVVCDNASSMKKAIDVSLPLLRAGDAWADVEEDYDEEVDVDIDDAFSPVEETSELLRNCPQRIACFAHTVQLSVQDGLKKIHEASELGRALENVGKIIKSVRRSSVAAPLLRKEGITLQAAVKTRWNSELTMIESVLKNVGEVNKAIALLAPDNRRSLRPIHETDVTALNELIDLLQPFAEVTKTTEGDAVITISSLVPAISYIERSIKSAKNAGARYTKHVLEALERSVNERLQQFKTLDNCVAALLDPSLKKTGLGLERDTEARREVERRFKVLRVWADKANSSGEDTPPNSPTKRRRMFAFLDDDDTPSPLKRRRGSARCPVEEYFGSPRDDGQEPLSFWREMAERECPQARTLAEVAREVLGLTATSASSERLFSVAGNILRDRRLNLRPTTFENLVILACNSDLFDSL